jgi:GTPase SAR1 family protein
VLRVLIGNKADMAEKREVSFEEGQELANFYGIPFLEASAKDTVNINETFLTIAKNVLEKINRGNTKVEMEDVHISEVAKGRKEVKNKCCL